MTKSAPTKGRHNAKRVLLARGTAVTVATLALTCAGATAAMAAEPAPHPQEVQFTQVLRPFESIQLPSMTCMSGSYLEDATYAPGRVVPPGVEVTEPGGVGVTVWRPLYGATEDGGKSQPLIGFDASNGQATATNWDPFIAKDLTVTLHCTGDITKAATRTIQP